MQTILQQLQAAFERTGWTMDQLTVELAERGGIRLDRSSLRRQMIGESKMRTGVAEALANVMAVAIAVVPEPAA